MDLRVAAGAAKGPWLRVRRRKERMLGFDPAVCRDLEYLGTQPKEGECNREP